MNFFFPIQISYLEKGGNNLTVKLVKKAQNGNKEALLQLILAKQDDYYRLAWSYMKNEHDALDVMEDMIVILYEKKFIHCKNANPSIAGVKPSL